MRIVLVGAGSVEFTRNLLGDILSYPELRTPRSSSTTSTRTGCGRPSGWPRTSRPRMGATPRVETHLDRRAALPGADVVINTIQVGGATATQGRLRGARPLRPALHDQRHDQRRRRAPRPAHRSRSSSGSSATWRTCARTPGSSTTRTRWRSSSARWPSRARSGRPGCATASTGRSTRSPATSACPPAEIDYVTAGVNHLAWVLRLEHDGEDLYPALRAAVDAGRVPADDLVRAELYPPLRLLPDRVVGAPRRVQPVVHPQGRSRRARFHIPIGEYLDRVANNLDEYADTKRRLDAGEPFEIERSGEYAAVIAHANRDRRAPPGSSGT